MTEAVSYWLLLKVFASGCTALTGVEAVSNGVKAFREPTVKNAQRTLTHCDYSSLVIEFARQGKNPCPEVVQWIDEKNRAVEHQIHSLRALQRKLRRFRRICSVSSVTTCAREEELCCLIEDLPNPQLEGDGHEKALPACSSSSGRTRS